MQPAPRIGVAIGNEVLDVSVIASKFFSGDLVKVSISHHSLSVYNSFVIYNYNNSFACIIITPLSV